MLKIWVTFWASVEPPSQRDTGQVKGEMGVPQLGRFTKHMGGRGGGTGKGTREGAGTGARARAGAGSDLMKYQII